MQALLIAAMLLAASKDSTLNVAFQPVRPVSNVETRVALRGLWYDACRPQSPRLERSGSDFTVALVAPRVGGCVGYGDWVETVKLGVLDPGTYRLTVTIDGYVHAVRELVVAEAEPSLRVRPDVVRLEGGDVEVCVTRSPLLVEPVTVTLGSQTFTGAQGDSACVRVRAPAAAAGAVDVAVEDANTRRTARAIFRYYDPSAPPDPAAFEPVLIPIVFNGPGAHGSLWETSVEVFNANYDMTLEPFAPGAPVVPSARAVSLTEWLGQRGRGVMYWIPRQIGADARFGARIRDVSRNPDRLGTELPIAREHDYADDLVFTSVPLRPGTRASLRLYAPDGDASSNVFVYVTDANGKTEWLSTKWIRDGRMELALHEDVGRESGLTGKVTIKVAGFFGIRLWGFVTVTDDQTQEVMIVRQQ